MFTRELDGYGKLSAVLWGDLTTYVLYTAYLSPNSVFNSVQEVAFGVGYNDAKLLGPFALNPSVLVAFEFDGQADAGRDKGVYAQIGIAPGYTFFPESTYPLAVSVPLAVGLLPLLFQPRAATLVPKGGMTMLDVLYIGLALGFLALSWGLVELCDRL